MACNRYLSTITNYQLIAFVKAVSHQLINNSLKKNASQKMQANLQHPPICACHYNFTKKQNSNELRSLTDMKEACLGKNTHRLSCRNASSSERLNPALFTGIIWVFWSSEL